MNVLAIDTATETLSVALSQANKVSEKMAIVTKNDHASHLMPTIVKVMERASVDPDELDEIIIGHGPGSYTGTRIGVTTAKTMAWALDIPIYSTSSLKATSLSALGQEQEKVICSFFDARRDAVYTGLYVNEDQQLTNKIADCHMHVNEWLDKLELIEGKICFVSPHLSTYEAIISNQLGDKAVFLPVKNKKTIAENLLVLHEHHQNNRKNVHTVIPNYIRKTEAEMKLEK